MEAARRNEILAEDYHRGSAELTPPDPRETILREGSPLLGLAASAFVIGLAGGVHCMAMCGGLVTALNLRPVGSPLLATPAPRRSELFLRQVFYSFGRVVTYACAGALAGAAGSLGLLYGRVLPVRMVLLVLANALVILLGLYLAGLGTSVLALERAGGALWRGLRRLGVKIAPARTLPGAFGMGVAWGWIPCGLVYGVLATALVAGSAARGAVVMAAFGLGTIPNLLAAGLAAQSLGSLVRRPRVRLAAGLAVILLGVIGLARVPGLPEHLKRGLHSLH